MNVKQQRLTWIANGLTILALLYFGYWLVDRAFNLIDYFSDPIQWLQEDYVIAQSISWTAWTLLILLELSQIVIALNILVAWLLYRRQIVQGSLFTRRAFRCLIYLGFSVFLVGFWDYIFSYLYWPILTWDNPPEMWLRTEWHFDSNLVTIMMAGLVIIFLGFVLNEARKIHDDIKTFT